MKEILDVILDSLIDTAKILPLLFLVYFFIELMECKNVFKFENSKALNSNRGPIMGALFGSVPQCGFSVVSSELYAERKISIGALVAVFVATSDEALPIMLSDYKAIPALLILILTKIIMATLIGYIAIFLHKRFFKNISPTHTEQKHEHIHACCNHDLEDSGFDWKHPLVHCLKITLYIFLFNILFGTLVTLIGEDNLMSFLKTSKALQPLFALIVGLIPNCASSVILTELYMAGGISFGAIVTGLSVNAGIGLIVLFKENKNKKENLFIVLSVVIPSLIIGYLLNFLPINLINF